MITRSRNPILYILCELCGISALILFILLLSLNRGSSLSFARFYAHILEQIEVRATVELFRTKTCVYTSPNRTHPTLFEAQCFGHTPQDTFDQTLQYWFYESHSSVLHDVQQMCTILLASLLIETIGLMGVHLKIRTYPNIRGLCCFIISTTSASLCAYTYWLLDYVILPGMKANQDKVYQQNVTVMKTHGMHILLSVTVLSFVYSIHSLFSRHKQRNSNITRSLVSKQESSHSQQLGQLTIETIPPLSQSDETQTS